MGDSEASEDSDEGEIKEAKVEQLIREVKETESYAFMIGAGTSKSAGIPTAGELIDRWQGECYRDCRPDEELDEWVEQQESEHRGENQTQYGYWFERLHPTRGARRQRIQDLVQDQETTPGHIILASLMSDEGERNYVPVTLTPNFDDLLFDAFYLYLEHRPQLINHHAVAPEFKLTRDDPAIVKLHGDYLYDNLQNTKTETESLEESMETAVSQTVGEYGLVVMGYGGNDESIMNALRKAEFSEYGVYWCVMEPGEDETVEDKLSGEAAELLRETDDSYVVPIKGFLNLMLEFKRRILDVSIPERGELKDRADERRDRIDDMIGRFSEESEDDEESENLDIIELMIEARELIDSSECEEAIGIYDQIIERDSEYAEAYIDRGYARGELGKYEAAIGDYDKAIELDPENPEVYNNRGNVKSDLGEYEAAIDDYDKAIELDPEDSRAYNNRGIAKRNLGEYEAAIEDYDRAIELDPENANAYNNRGYTKRNLGKHEAAIEDYGRAIELSPGYPAPPLNRSKAHLQLDEIEQARDYAKEGRQNATSTDKNAGSLLLYLIPATLLEEDTQPEEQEYRDLCRQDFTTQWSFTALDDWLENIELEPEKADKISELIDLLREHKPDNQ